MEEFHEIKKIYFSISSTEDILNKSVCSLKITKNTNEEKNGIVYDPKTGALFNKKCETCKEYEKNCTGHFSHLELNAPIVNPILFSHVFNILKIICHVCSNLIITKQHLEFNNINRYEGEKKILETIKKVKKVTKCFHCNAPKREYKLKKDPFFNIIQWSIDNSKFVDIDDLEIKKIFEDIDETSLEILKISHPKHCILEVFPIIPPCCRPYEYIGNTIKEDDLTKQILDIVKANISITTAEDKQAAIFNLKHKIEMYCRTPKKKTKTITTEPIKNIKERLTGKDGQLRENLMGKRTEMAGRTVIGPGTHLKLDEVGIPKDIANAITFPIIVCEKNYEEVLSMIKNKQVEKIKRDDQVIRIDLQQYSEILKVLKKGDIIVRNGKQIKVVCPKMELFEGDIILRNGINVTPPFIPKINKVNLKIGDVAQRRIINGDWVLMNRQPTLWKGSMMAFKAVISNAKTFSFNLAVCKAFNADFDGDEQNAHFPQSIESSIELKLLSTPTECILSSTDGTPVIVILQDALLGAYLMSISDFKISWDNYNDILMTLTGNSIDYYLKRKEEITKILIEKNQYKNKNCLLLPKNIISLLFPSDFCYKDDNLEIYNGVILRGYLSKNVLGSSKKSFIIRFKIDYCSQVCVDFINNIQFMTNKWLTFHSFTIHLDDCLPIPNLEPVIYNKLQEVKFLSDNILNKKFKEIKTNVCLNSSKDIGIKIASEEKNNFVHTITSGSKGDYFNLGQVKGLLGQQIVAGGRIQKNIDNCSRTLIHYRKKETNLKTKYESRGYITQSFAEGLSPQAFFFHAISGREGVCDTQMMTFKSGYNTRKIVKLTEDIKIQNDGIVSDASGNIFDFKYGEYGFNPETCGINVDKIIKDL